jgi:hypothetical protein
MSALPHQFVRPCFFLVGRYVVYNKGMTLALILYAFGLWHEINTSADL